MKNTRLMLSNDVLVVTSHIYFKICPINKNVDILQNMDTKAQTNDVTTYHIVLLCILSNDRRKTIIGNNCSKGYIGDKLERILWLLYYYPDIVQSVTKRTCDKDYSASHLKKSMNRHMKERKLNKDSRTIIF